MYARLGIYFDAYASESQVSHAELVKLVGQLKELGATEEEANGAIRVDLDAYGLEKPVLRKEDGAFIYLSRDVVEAAERWRNWKFDEMLYVVGKEQEDHFKRVSGPP